MDQETMALMTYDEKTSISKVDEKYLERVGQHLARETFPLIGQRAYYRKYFEALTRGVEANFLREIPTAWKLFRRKGLLREHQGAHERGQNDRRDSGGWQSPYSRQ